MMYFKNFQRLTQINCVSSGDKPWNSQAKPKISIHLKRILFADNSFRQNALPCTWNRPDRPPLVLNAVAAMNDWNGRATKVAQCLLSASTYACHFEQARWGRGRH